MQTIFSFLEWFQKKYFRFSNSFDSRIVRLSEKFLFTAPDHFVVSRSYDHLCRLLLHLYFSGKDLEHYVKSLPQVRHLFLRIKKFQLKEGKKVLGLSIALNFVHDNERLEQKHILKAVLSCIPGVRAVTSSFCSLMSGEGKSLLCYLEIEKLRGRDFSTQEILFLKEQLPSEIKSCVESLTPSLFIPPNNEEAFRNCILLSKELKYVHDLPQVMIIFQAQQESTLLFTINLLRLLKKDTLSLESIQHRLPPSVYFQSQLVSILGLLRKKIPKEANIFILEVESALFLRKNYSIDLRQAREYVVKALEQLVGPFRDYNGGFLTRQKEKLQQIKREVVNHFPCDDYHIENFFYSLNPSIIQAILSSRAIGQLFSLFWNLINRNVNDAPYLFEIAENAHVHTAGIKTADPHLKNLLLEKLNECQITSVFLFASSEREIDGFWYLCYLVQTPTNRALFEALEEGLASYHKVLLRKFSCIRPEKSLRLNFQEGDPPSLNPHIGIDIRCRSLGKSLFEGLTRLNKQGAAIPAAARTVHISSCRKKYTFTLRPHQWSNGEPVTAFHFETTWKRALDPSSSCLRPDLFYPIFNASDVKKGRKSPESLGIKALDSQTFQVTLAHPAPFFPELVAHPIFSPLYANEKEPTVFNGPFIVRLWKREDSLILTRNPYYWDLENVHVQEIHISMIKDPYAALRQYARGEFDWIGDPFCLLPHETIPFLKSSPEFSAKPVARIYWLYCNTEHPALSSPSIRAALAYSVNRSELAKEIFLGQIPHHSPLPSSFLKEPISEKENLDYAFSLFKKGLKELNLSLNTFPTIRFMHSDIAGQKEFAAYLKNKWETWFKIPIELVPVEWNTLSSAFDKREYDIGGCIRSPQYCDPLSHLELFQERNHLYNSSGWENIQFKALLERAKKTSNLNKRKRLLREAERILIHEMPVIPIFRHVYHFLTKNYLNQVFISDYGDADFKCLTIN